MTDPGGLILDAARDPRATNRAHGINLVVGGHWEEALVGANAIGTALTTGQPRPQCGTMHDVEAPTPWYPVIHDFEPDIDAFYQDWLGLPLPERVD